MMLQRILSDLRDLWTLITKGQPEVDPLLPWRMMADLAKFQPAPVDIDRWEAEQYARNPLAVWFDPDRYAGTQYDWSNADKLRALTVYRDALLSRYGNLDSDKRFIKKLEAMHNDKPNPYANLLNPVMSFRIQSIS